MAKKPTHEELEKKIQEDELRNQSEKIIQERLIEKRYPSDLTPEETQRLLHELQLHQIELELQNEELRSSQQALIESATSYTEFYDMGPVGYLTINSKGIITKVNLVLTDMLSFERRHLLNQPLSARIFFEDQDIYYRHLQKLSTLKTRQVCELRMKKKNQALFYVRLESTAILDEYGEVDRYRAVVIDITERKKTETELIETKAILQAAMDNSPVAIAIADAPDGKLRYVNEAGLNIRGGTKEDIVEGIDIDKYVSSWQLHRLDGTEYKTDDTPLARAIIHGEKCSDEFIIKNTDGENRIVLANAAPIHDNKGNVKFGIVLFLDITDQKKLQDETLKLHKLESLGMLAGGIAHDFNNLLYVVMANISLVEDKFKPLIGESKNLKAAQEACIKAGELTAQMITFSKGGNPVKKMMAINDLLKDRVISALSGSNITPKISITDAIKNVNIDEGQIKQVFHNIIANAKEAMNNNGQLKVSCENVDIAKEGYLTLSQGEYIKISFEDQGCGISKENLEKIFDPYFSTKAMGADKGQGLGLTVCYSIIQKHGGLINVKSEPQTGSTFSVYLPAFLIKKIDLQKTEEKPTAQKPVKQPATGKGKILFMDDEVALRDALGQLINRLGYNVETCIEGKEAVEIYTKAMKFKEPFDVVILDLTNKIGLGGQATMKRLLEIDHDAKGIIISGYSDDPVIANFRAYGFSSFIIKPATQDELSKAISEVILKDQKKH